MKNENTNTCCNNYSHKIIFSSNEYEWKICEKCDLIYQLNNSEKINKVKEIQFNNFSEPAEGGKSEFISILKKLKKYSNLSNLTFFDFGCADGSFLKIAEKYFRNVQGMEPNLLLKNKALRKKLNILDDNFLDNKVLHYDVIFTRNTFEYVTGFAVSLSKLMNKLNDNGYFIWRDKFYDYYPKKYFSKDFSYSFNSLPTKNAIKYHLSINQIEILECRFYFDKSFLIIGQKKKNLNKIYKKKINMNTIFYNNFMISKIIFYLSNKIHIVYMLIRKLKNFF